MKLSQIFVRLLGNVGDVSTLEGQFKVAVRVAQAAYAGFKEFKRHLASTEPPSATVVVESAD